GLGSEYFLAGLLLDIGRLAMLKTISTQYIPVLEAARDKNRNLPEVEREMLGFDHTEIGVQLMKNWGLPEMLQNAVQHHHASREQIAEQQESPDFPLIK